MITEAFGLLDAVVRSHRDLSNEVERRRDEFFDEDGNLVHWLLAGACLDAFVSLFKQRDEAENRRILESVETTLEQAATQGDEMTEYGIEMAFGENLAIDLSQRSAAFDLDADTCNRILLLIAEFPRVDEMVEGWSRDLSDDQSRK